MDKQNTLDEQKFNKRSFPGIKKALSDAQVPLAGIIARSANFSVDKDDDLGSYNLKKETKETTDREKKKRNKQNKKAKELDTNQENNDILSEKIQTTITKTTDALSENLASKWDNI